MPKFLQNFQRITSNNQFIPQIDGLRFIAIAAVFLHHFQGKLLKHYELAGNIEESLFYRLLHHGDFGVPLFFVISGFILAMPFAKYHLGHSNRKIKLKAYFIRRLTRLESPYFIVILGCFGFYVLVDKDIIFREQLPHIISALFYTHNIFYNELLQVNLVTWSLEIEVQFYIMAPILALVYKLKNAPRRLVLVALIFIFPLLNSVYPPSIRSLYGYFHYFLLGFLLVDIYIAKPKIKVNSFVSSGLGLLCLFFIFYLDSRGAWPIVWTQLGLIFILYNLALNEKFWQSVFSNMWLSTIGGMCYTIYLIHFPLMGFLMKSLLRFQITEYYAVNFIVQFLIVGFVTLIVSGIFFRLIEKPCMKRYWYKEIRFRFIPQLKSKAA